MHLKIKTVAFTIFLSFLCPLDTDDIPDYSLINGSRKYTKNYKIKDKRCINNFRNNFSKNKKIFDDAELCVEQHQIKNSSTVFLYCYFYLADFTSPVTKYAVWSKATFV